MYLTKVLWRRFQQCFGRFTMLLVEESSETALFTQNLSTFSESVISEIQNLWRSSFFSKYLKFHLDFKNVGKTCERTFCFWENCIWIGMIKFSLLRTGYFSLAGNVLTSSPKIFHVNKTELSNSMALAVVNEYHKSAAWWFEQCLGTFTMLLHEGSSQTALFTHLYDYFYGVRIFENTKSLRVIFFSKTFEI